MLQDAFLPSRFIFKALPKIRICGWWVGREHSPSLSKPGSSHCCQTDLKGFTPCKASLPGAAEFHRLANVSLKLHLHEVKIKKSSYNLVLFPGRNNSKTSSPGQAREMLCNALLESALQLYWHYLSSSITATEQRAGRGKVRWKLDSKRDTVHLKFSSLRRTELSCLFRRKHVWLTLSLHLIGTDEQ